MRPLRYWMYTFRVTTLLEEKQFAEMMDKKLSLPPSSTGIGGIFSRDNWLSCDIISFDMMLMYVLSCEKIKQ